MNIIRRLQIAWLTRKLRALAHDITFARHDVRRHINHLRREIRKTEQRLFALAIEQRSKGNAND